VAIIAADVMKYNMMMKELYELAKKTIKNFKDE